MESVRRLPNTPTTSNHQYPYFHRSKAEGGDIKDNNSIGSFSGTLRGTGTTPKITNKEGASTPRDTNTSTTATPRGKGRGIQDTSMSYSLT